MKASSPSFRLLTVPHLAALVVLLVGLGVASIPFFRDMSTYGFHDWDSHIAYRYITTLSLRAGEGPWWHPYMSGGYPAWGYVEGATNLISPYLPLYLIFPAHVAVRFEFLGSALAALVGTYLLANRFTRSAALAAAVAVLFALNGRWALQMTAGHTWHMRYALLPWVFLAYDISLERGRGRWALYAGMLMALMVYMGGIYPAPHTAMLLSVYGLVLAIMRRTWRPLISLVIIGVTAPGLAMPKLLPIADTMSRTPRLIPSPESVDLGQLLVMMTERAQSFYGRPVNVPIHGWHEYGIYVGWAGVAILFIGAFFARGKRGQATRIAGLVAFLLGLGSFHPSAPWPLLHRLPMFSSQWVPSRYLYPMTLLLGLAFVSVVGPWFDGFIARRRWVDVVALIPVLCLALDLASVDRATMEIAFQLIAPDAVPAPGAFHQELRSPVQYKNPDPHADSVLLAMYANVGCVIAYGTPIFGPGHAIPRGAPEYRGEAHVEQGTGEAKITRWTPNSATVEVHGATPGSIVVYNQNFDASWNANGVPAVEFNELVSAPVPPGGTGVVQFRYYPRRLNAGLLVLFLTLLGAFGVPHAPKLWRRAMASRALAHQVSK